MSEVTSKERAARDRLFDEWSAMPADKGYEQWLECEVLRLRLSHEPLVCQRCVELEAENDVLADNVVRLAEQRPERCAACKGDGTLQDGNCYHCGGTGVRPAQPPGTDDARDAARYRWLRAHQDDTNDHLSIEHYKHVDPKGWENLDNELLDAYVDRWIALTK